MSCRTQWIVMPDLNNCHAGPDPASTKFSLQSAGVFNMVNAVNQVFHLKVWRGYKMGILNKTRIRHSKWEFLIPPFLIPAFPHTANMSIVSARCKISFAKAGYDRNINKVPASCEVKNCSTEGALEWEGRLKIQIGLNP